MLHFDVLTLFPGIFSSFLEEGLINKGIERKLLKIELINFRKHGVGKHLKVDDSPYGGGPGMLLRVEPIALSIAEQKEKNLALGQKTHTILLTPQGKPFTQEKAKELSLKEEVLTLICGRYEGFDERVRGLVDEEISGGNFVCLGGEVIAMTIIEAVSRLKPNFLGNFDSAKQESFTESLLEFPQYTRPEIFEGLAVPKELLSGNHAKINEWRKNKAFIKTKKIRPDLLKNYESR